MGEISSAPTGRCVTRCHREGRRKTYRINEKKKEMGGQNEAEPSTLRPNRIGKQKPKYAKSKLLHSSARQGNTLGAFGGAGERWGWAAWAGTAGQARCGCWTNAAVAEPHLGEGSFALQVLAIRCWARGTVGSSPLLLPCCYPGRAQRLHGLRSEHTKKKRIKRGNDEFSANGFAS